MIETKITPGASWIASPSASSSRLSAAFRAVFVLVTLAICMHAEAKSLKEGGLRKLEWDDVIQCPHELKYDPKKYDEQRLLNTVELLLVGNILIPRTADERFLSLQARLELRTKAGAEHIAQLAGLPLIDLPGIEDYRKMEIDQLEDWYEHDRLILRAEMGDASALREQTASVGQCSRFIDALEGKIDIQAVWAEVIGPSCAKMPKSETCREEFYARAREPDAAEKIRHDVLWYGWQPCATPYLKINSDKRLEPAASSLEAKFKALFRIRKPHICPDDY